MNHAVPRLRMFAGPNGSGKSTIKNMVPEKLLGVYLNPDEIQKDIEDRGFLNVRDYGVGTTREEILPFFVNSTLIQKAELEDEASCLRFTDGKLDFFEVIVNAYFASIAADFLRQKLQEQRVSFSFSAIRFRCGSKTPSGRKSNPMPEIPAPSARLRTASSPYSRTRPGLTALATITSASGTSGRTTVASRWTCCGRT